MIWDIVECERMPTYWQLLYMDGQLHTDGSMYRHGHVIPAGSLERWLVVNDHFDDAFTGLESMLLWMLDHTGLFKQILVPMAHEVEHPAHKYAASVDMELVRHMRAFHRRAQEPIGMPNIAIDPSVRYVAVG